MTDALARRLADSLPAERLGRWTDGRRELPLVAPDTEEGWRECLRLAHSGGHRVHPLGAETKAAWCPVPAGTELVLSTAAWTGVVAYEPEDGTLTARSGAVMAELAATVAGGGHLLCPDVALAERATLGGVIGAGQSGFDRLRQGGIRDALLGTQVLLADGRSSKSGGRLVKNVTGYDLHRLWCGSRGSLCVVLEASLRLWPLPRERRTLTLDVADPAAGFAAAARLYAETGMRPAAVCLHDAPDGACTLLVALQGRPEVIAEEATRLGALFPDADVADADAADAADAEWKRLRDRGALHPSLELQTRPTEIASVVERAREAGASCLLTAQPLLGCATLSFAGEVDLHAQAERIAAAVSPRARVLLRGAAGGLPVSADLPAPARAMMERIKQSYDPTGVFAAGVPA